MTATPLIAPTDRPAPPPAAAPRRDGPLRVAVLVITRNRPRMLADLLRSLQAMRRPPGAELAFVVVENAAALTLEPVVAPFRAAVAPAPVHLAIEPDLGIPIARNRACAIALAEGADLLAFVDDDEQVAPDWLERLVARWRETGLALVGGPVLAAFDGAPGSRWQRWMRDGVAARYDRKARKAEAATRAGRQDRVSVVTNNWLAEAALFTRHGLRFDPALRFTGGSDTAFWRDARARGLATGWAPDARVIETVPVDRVSWRYQFHRAAEQSRTSLADKVRRRGWARAAAAALPVAVARAAGLVALVAVLPFARGPGLVTLARSAGWLAGRVSGLFGARSALYRETTGS